MNKKNSQTQTDSQLLTCPVCGAAAVRSETKPDRFTYGSGNDAVDIEVFVPVRICAQCDFEYMDAEAEVIRHEAVCKHLRLLSPREIQGVRKQYQMSRAEFAAAVRIGEASLARWERGELTQNPANDQLLYLLMFRDNMERLRDRAKRKAVLVQRTNPEPEDEPRETEARFPALKDIPTAQRQARGFALNGAGA